MRCSPCMRRTHDAAVMGPLRLGQVARRAEPASGPAEVQGPEPLVQGHALDIDVLIDAGIETADACVVATDGDNTNIVIAQVAQKRFHCPCVVTRILDPARAAFYSSLGLQTVCATSAALESTTQAICATPGRAA